MSKYAVEITASFKNTAAAEKFAAEFEAETGNAPERSGKVVTGEVFTHGDEFALKSLAEELGGSVEVKIIQDVE
jgi:hypothetical protein